MTIADLNPGAVITRTGEEIYIDDKSQRKVGVRVITEFRVRRRRETTSLWITGAQVQQWLDAAVSIKNPVGE